MARRLLVKIPFSREHAKQQLSMNKMMSYLLTSSTPFIEDIELMPMAHYGADVTVGVEDHC